MPTIYVDDCPVEFPHQPYPCQLHFLRSVLSACRSSSHALLESPTGTGKTLGLLCGSLAWRVEEMAKRQREIQINPLDSGPERPPLIIYASRTHSQLSQCVAELRRTSYRPRIAIIGGREQMCLKAGVRELSGSAMGAVCQRLVKRKACEFHQRVGQVKLSNSGSSSSNNTSGNGPNEPEIWDIESLVGFASKHAACPYYLSRELLKDADLVFMPYNYLLDGRTRAALSTEIDLKNAVVIFDEAHNVESSCYDAVNCELHSDDLAQAIKELEGCKKLLQDASSYGLDVRVNVEAIDPAIRFLKSLLAKLDDPGLGALVAERGFHSQPGDAVFALLEGAGFASAGSEATLKDYEELAKVLIEDQYTRRSSKRLAWLDIVTALRTIYGNNDAEGDSELSIDASAHEVTARNTERLSRLLLTARQNYRLVFTQQAGGKRSLAFWCFNPGVVMRELVEKGVRSVILASGTLSPMRSFIQELQLDFKFILENDHVIGDDQVYASVIPIGPSLPSVPLNSSFTSRSSEAYQRELGLTVLRLAQCVPEGLLVFFPSYQVMEGCLKVWQQSRLPGGETIYQQIAQVKAPLTEPKSKQDLPALMAHYSKLIADGRGAVLFAVCRGKVSEGLDFADGLARGVIVTGIPYPPFKDPKIILKKQYLQDLPGSTLSGQEWYSQQATRAVNQALGRVIRHRSDYGAVLLCDERFAQPQASGQLSKWLRGRVRTAQGKAFGEIEGELREFFASKKVVQSRPVIQEAKRMTETSHATLLTPVTQSLSASAFNIDADGEFAGPKVLLPMSNLARPEIKKFDWFESKAPTPSATTTQVTHSVPLQPRKQHSQLAQSQAQEYLKRVQAALPSAASFHAFKTHLADFKKGLLDVESLLKQICQLFSTVATGATGRELFADFQTFVPEKHRQLHARILQESFTSKAAKENTSPHNPVVDLTSSPASTTSLPAKRKLHPDLIGKRPVVYEPLYTGAVVNPFAKAAEMVTVTSNGLSSTATDGLSSTVMNGLPTTVMNGLPSIPTTITPAAPSTSTTSNTTTAPLTDKICPICRDPVADSHRAKCGHEACHGCWLEWLNRTLECPLCRQRTRIPQLRPSSG